MRRALLVLITSILTAHLLWSFLVAYSFEYLYSNRPPNLTKITNVAKDWEPFLHAFWYANTNSNQDLPKLVFVGSSVTYGYPWVESSIFSSKIQRVQRDWKVINLSYLGADIVGIQEYLLCPLENDQANKPDILIVEIPLVNTLPYIKSYGSIKKRECEPKKNLNLNYFKFLVTRPIGVGWIPVIFGTDSRQTKERPIHYAGSNYFYNQMQFNVIEQVYRKELSGFLGRLSTLGHRVFVFVSPIHLPGVEKVGGNLEAVQSQLRVTMEVCKLHINIKCMPMSEFNQDPEMFSNVTHLSKSGHEKFSEWVLQNLGL